MKHILLWGLFFCLSSLGFAQVSKFDLARVKFNCPPTNPEIQELYTTGFAALKSGDNVDIAGKIFLNILSKDESMCDAHFWIGVCLTEMKKEKNAVMYYYYADSLSTSSNLIFKRELAEAGIRTGLLGLANQKYQEITHDFPNEVEGYLGIAVVATSTGSTNLGLENLALAESKLSVDSPLAEKQRNQIDLLYAILFTQQEKYDQAIIYLNRCKDMYSELEDWNANYAWAAYNLYLIDKNEKWKAESEAALFKIKDNVTIKQSFFDLFKYD